MIRFAGLSIGVLASVSLGVIGAQAYAQTAPTPPPYVGVYQPRGVDEVGLWEQDDEMERKLAASPIVIRDEALSRYVKDVLCRTVGTDRCDAARVYILREPSFNATMSPNGTMRVYSGLLLRVRNEAELAAILGHEFGHFENRHSLEGFKKRRTATDILAWGSLLASMSGSYDVRRSYQSIELSVYGNFFRYKRDQEREADLLGLGYLNASELPPQAASKVWTNLMAEIEASSVSRGLKKPKFDAIAFTASHPPEKERASYLTEFAAPEGADRDDGSARYAAAMVDWIPVFLSDQIKLNDFGGSDYIIESLAENGWTADLWFARGELYRARGHQRDLVNASKFYEEAILLAPDHPQAHRGLGLSLLKTGDSERAYWALAEFLRLAPDASDSAMIKMLLPLENLP